MSMRALPLNYIREALNQDEKIVHVGRFHWFYDVTAWFWLVICIFAGALVIGGGATWVINADLDKAFPDVPPELRGDAINSVVAHYGGWIPLVRDLHWGTKIVAALCCLWGVFIFVNMMVIKYTTEIAVTTQRLIYKRGVIARFIGEMKLDRIEGINVWQSFFGRIFCYGRVMVRGIGVGEVLLPELEDPIKFRKSIDFARSKLEDSKNVSLAREIDREIDHAHNPVDN